MDGRNESTSRRPFMLRGWEFIRIGANRGGDCWHDRFVANGGTEVSVLLRGPDTTYAAKGNSSCHKRKQMTLAAKVVQASWISASRS